MVKEFLATKIRVLKPGWWLLHSIGITKSYLLGHLLCM